MADLWHVWIELDGSVYGLHGVHLRRAQPSPRRGLWREPETRETGVRDPPDDFVCEAA